MCWESCGARLGERFPDRLAPTRSGTFSAYGPCQALRNNHQYSAPPSAAFPPTAAPPSGKKPPMLSLQPQSVHVCDVVLVSRVSASVVSSGARAACVHSSMYW